MTANRRFAKTISQKEIEDKEAEVECLLAEDSKAGRLILSYAAAFARKFFKQNLISQVGIIGMYNGVAVRISDVGGNPSEYLGRLKGLENQDPQGNPSLQNALELC